MNINRKQKDLIKIYIILFLVIWAVMNWDSVSWIFNYQEISGLAYDFFNPYQQSDISVNAQSNDTSSNISVDSNIINTEVAPVKLSSEENFPASDKPDSLEIPSIGLVTSLVVGESTNVATLEKQLDQGVVYYPGSSLPTSNGQILILGHSAPPNWPHIKHDWVFSDLNNLNQGDKIMLYLNGREYSYSVTKKNIIKKGEDVDVGDLAQNNSVLTLVSCWPPGKNYERIAVQASPVKP